MLGFSVVAAAVPKHDMVGDDDGYRRAFNALYLRPGLFWTINDDMSYFANIPITVHRNLEVPGSFPDTQLSSGFVYRW